MDDWQAANRAMWDESVPVHVRSVFYDVAALRAGTARLYPIEQAELGGVSGLDVLHLQCHFGYDSLVLAQAGARVTGLDFSAPAIAAARSLADELGLAGQARFVQADLYDAVQALDAPGRFDLVFVSWGALMWLHDIRGWAAIVAHFLKPGGRLYLAEGHPVAWTVHGAPADGAGPRWDVPYFHAGPVRDDNGRDYADESVVLAAASTSVFLHPLGALVTALIDAGLSLEYLHEHDAVPWRMYDGLRSDADRLFRWPDQRWLPLAFSLSARRRSPGP